MHPITAPNPICKTITASYHWLHSICVAISAPYHWLLIVHLVAISAPIAANLYGNRCTQCSNHDDGMNLHRKVPFTMLTCSIWIEPTSIKTFCPIYHHIHNDNDIFIGNRFIDLNHVCACKRWRNVILTTLRTMSKTVNLRLRGRWSTVLYTKLVSPTFVNVSLHVLLTNLWFFMAIHMW